MTYVLFLLGRVAILLVNFFSLYEYRTVLHLQCVQGSAKIGFLVLMLRRRGRWRHDTERSEILAAGLREVGV